MMQLCYEHGSLVDLGETRESDRHRGASSPVYYVAFGRSIETMPVGQILRLDLCELWDGLVRAIRVRMRHVLPYKSSVIKEAKLEWEWEGMTHPREVTESRLGVGKRTHRGNLSCSSTTTLATPDKHILYRQEA
jgi:hypothetical protein